MSLIGRLRDKTVSFRQRVFAEKNYLYAVVLLTLAIFIGQVVEAGAFSLEDLPDAVRDIIDPVQYMIGLMIIGLILIVRVIRKYEVLPNPFLVIMKWYFVILFLNDFIVLIFRVIQKSNILSFTNSFSGVGKVYLIFASVRAITDLTISSIATGLLVYGLARYKFVNEDTRRDQVKLSRTIILLILIKVLSSVPVNMTGMLTNQILFIVSLVISQTVGVVITALIYMLIKNQLKTYKTKFFKILNTYYVISLAVTALNCVYSMFSYGFVSRFPAGEMGSLGGFGNIVLFVSLIAGAIQNYLMYTAVDGYNEGETVTTTKITVLETTETTIAGEKI